ncbi:HNH endonuclease [Agreia sp. Leaf283]|uniref:HNH endonuclease n=1 Tax=Agreia sp. Leaf283 TaxID=1736321 RepID=UPI000A6320FE|nr:HNH endonuclease [Agreia sp. Leaf283]
MLDRERLAANLNAELELPFVVKPLGSDRVEVRINGLDRPNGFSVQAHEGMQLTFAELRLDSLARELLDAARVNFASTGQRFGELYAAYRNLGVNVAFRLNGIELQPSQVDLATTQWNTLELDARVLRLTGVDDEAAANVVSAVVALFVSLLPLDAGTGAFENESFAEEGKVRYGVSKSYERSRSNRAIAILAHGTKCVVCDFSFEDFYGAIGRGYVEVHHLLPVHLMDGPAVLNPLTDLVPLCANCHRMAHRVDPPLTPLELLAATKSIRGSYAD